MRPAGSSSSFTQLSVDCARKAMAPRPRISMTSNAKGAPVGSYTNLATIIPLSMASNTARNGENPRQERDNPLRSPFRRPLGSGGCCERFRDLVLAVLAYFDKYIPKVAKNERGAAEER